MHRLPSIRPATFLAILGCASISGSPMPLQAAETPAVATGGKAQTLRDLPYVTGGHERQRLDLFLPAHAGPRAVVVWIHGGGWEGGSKTNSPADGLLARGYAVASVGYRLSHHATYPAQIEDCKAAVRWLRAHAAEYQLDPARIGVWGASAGGHLAALLGATAHVRDFDTGENLDQSSRVQCVVDWFGPADFLHYGEPPLTAALDQPRGAVAKLLGGPLSQRLEVARKASPLYFVQPDAAPFLIMQGDQDHLVPHQQSEVLHAALRKAGVESTLKIFPGAGHGGAVFGSPEALGMMTAFLDRHLGQRSAAK